MSSLDLAAEGLNDVWAALAPLDEVDPAATVVLIGSAARGRMTWRSDIDLIVITDEQNPNLVSPARIHFHPETRIKFLERLRNGDEFASWAVRYGLALRDPEGWWEANSHRKLPWPDWRQKLIHIGRRLRTAEAAIRDGDCEAAEEELLMAASHCSRALLLKRKDFPLSRPELPAQLAAVGEDTLGNLLSELMGGGGGLSDLKSAFASLRRIHRRLRLMATVWPRSGAAARLGRSPARA